MGHVSVKMKIMPESPSVNLKDLEAGAGIIIKKNSGINPHFMEEPIAFGLKAVIASFEYPEEKELETLEKELGKIKNVKSVELKDIRRAIG
ncbi:MAG TPA: elongation factor 1-beta [Candidatus Omnitrophota bacterium]|nr:elongation factor 1-beta [Candidatus Omnitrophota bacterium]